MAAASADCGRQPVSLAVEAAIAPVAAADEASATETVKKVEKREVDKKKLADEASASLSALVKAESEGALSASSRVSGMAT